MVATQNNQKRKKASVAGQNGAPATGEVRDFHTVTSRFIPDECAPGGARESRLRLAPATKDVALRQRFSVLGIYDFSLASSGGSIFCNSGI